MEDKKITVIEKKTTDVVATANKMIVQDQKSYDLVDNFLSTIKGLRKEVAATFDPLIEEAHLHHKNILAEKARHDQPLAQAEQIVKSKSIAFIREQERIQAEKQRELEEAARKEEERQRKIKEEQERAWREKEEAARKEAERQAAIAAKAKSEKARAEAESAAARAREEAEKANAKAQEKQEAAASVFVPVPEVASTFNQSASQSVKKLWKCEVLSVMELCKAVVAGTLPVTCLDPNMTVLNGLAKTMQDKVKFPGLRFYSEDSLAKRLK